MFREFTPMATQTIRKTRSATERPPRKSSKAAWGGVGSDAVAKATGRSWDEWCKVLDKDGAAKLPHKEIAEHVHAKYNVGDWWSQMVTVGYEQARGLRAKHQKADGFSASASRVFSAPMVAVFKAVSDVKQRSRWLPDELTVTKATPGKSVRIAWNDGTRVAVGFYDKTGKGGSKKTQITFQHDKLKNAAAVARTKRFWASRLDALGEVLEG
jgi:hypothetical protein